MYFKIKNIFKRNGQGKCDDIAKQQHLGIGDQVAKQLDVTED